jgi:ADP-heptose:LPS heptosyltransferase
VTSQRVLVLHLGALGDLVLALPAIAELAHAAEVEAWGPSVERLSVALAPRGPIARVRSLPHALFGETPPSLEGFGRIVVFARREGPLARNLPRAHFVSTEPGGHVSDVLLDQLTALGLARTTALRHPALEAAAERKDGLVVQPGAGGRGKRWPAERFAEVVRRSGLEATCLLGPAELDPPDVSLEVAPRIVRAPPTEELVQLLAGARAFLGNDAGVTHLAAALGTPTVAVFGPTDPARWGPRGRGPIEVVRAPSGDLAGLEVEPVLEALGRVARRV